MSPSRMNRMMSPKMIETSRSRHEAQDVSTVDVEGSQIDADFNGIAATFDDGRSPGLMTTTLVSTWLSEYNVLP